MAHSAPKWAEVNPGSARPDFFVVTKCKSFEVNMLCYNEMASLGWDYPGNPGHTKNPCQSERDRHGNTQV